MRQRHKPTAQRQHLLFASPERTGELRCWTPSSGPARPILRSCALSWPRPTSQQLVVPYRGVRFDAPGQNEPVRPIPVSKQKGKYSTVYPFEPVPCPVLFPTPTWAEKAKM